MTRKRGMTDGPPPARKTRASSPPPAPPPAENPEDGVPQGDVEGQRAEAEQPDEQGDEQELQVEIPQPEPTQASLPAIGDMVMFHTKVRRAGIIRNTGVPAFVTGIEDGKLSLTVLELGRISFVKRIGNSRHNPEYWSHR